MAKTLKEFLVEYLTPAQKAAYSSTQMTPDARAATNHFFGYGNDKVVETVRGTEQKSETHKKVENHLGQEIDLDSYRAGLAKDRHGRSVKIGKMIDHAGLRDEFARDPVRAGAKASNAFTMSIHRGVEVAGQTNPEPDDRHPTGHSWKDMSCKNVSSGSNRHYLFDEIKHGTVAVFGHDHDGKEIYRATLQPHINPQGNRMYAIDSEYGVVAKHFTDHANSVAERLSQPHHGDIVYTKHNAVYDDSGRTEAIHPSASGKDLAAHIKSQEFDINGIPVIARHKNFTSDHVDDILHQTKGKNLNQGGVFKRLLVNSSKVTPEQMRKMFNDSVDDDIKYDIMKHPNFNKDLHDLVTKDDENAEASSPLTHKDRLIELATTSNSDANAPYFAARNSSLSAEDIHTIATHPETQRDAHIGLAQNPNISKKTVDDMIQWGDSKIVEHLSPKLTTKEQLHTLKDRGMLMDAFEGENHAPVDTEIAKHVFREHPGSAAITLVNNAKGMTRDALGHVLSAASGGFGGALIRYTQQHPAFDAKTHVPVMQKNVNLHNDILRDGNPSLVTKDFVRDIVRGDIQTTRPNYKLAVEHPHTTPADLHAAIKDGPEVHAKTALTYGGDKIKEDHILAGLNHESPGVRVTAASAQNQTAKTLLAAARHHDQDVQFTAFNEHGSSPLWTHQHIEHALNSTDPDVKAAAERIHQRLKGQ